METRRLNALDLIVGEIDKVIKNLTLPPKASRAAPGARDAAELSEADRRESLRLMRINHAGEVAAQALYQGQALTARDPKVKEAKGQAASEEIDHLAGCEQRLGELQDRPSLLNPVWYVGSLGIGALGGAIGDAASLGFIAEIEHQVESHLRDHLARLSPEDSRSRAILEQMRREEIGHGAKAAAMGGKALPFPITW